MLLKCVIYVEKNILVYSEAAMLAIYKNVRTNMAEKNTISRTVTITYWTVMQFHILKVSRT